MALAICAIETVVNKRMSDSIPKNCQSLTVRQLHSLWLRNLPLYSQGSVETDSCEGLKTDIEVKMVLVEVNDH